MADQILSRTGTIRVPKVAELTAKQLRERIIAHQMPVGARLSTESELMEDFGIGRVAARETLRILERDGLVEIRRGVGGGVFVRHPGTDELSEIVSLLFAVQGTTLREFLDYRLLIEPTAAGLAAKYATEQQRKEFERLVSVPYDLSLEQVPNLHFLVADASQNSVLSVTFKALHHAFAGHFRTSKIAKAHIEQTHVAHTKIAKSILQGDSQGAQRAMSVHLNAYADYLKEQNLLNETLVPQQNGHSSLD